MICPWACRSIWQIGRNQRLPLRLRGPSGMRRGSEDRRGHCFEGVGFAIVATWLDLIDLCLVRKDLLLRAGLPLRERLPNTVNVGANKQPSPSVQLRSWQELRRGAS
jgi:hypothetical protein